MEKYCTNCGHELRDGDKFCSECGTVVGGQALPPQLESCEITFEELNSPVFSNTCRARLFVQGIGPQGTYTVAVSPVEIKAELYSGPYNGPIEDDKSRAACDALIRQLFADGWTLTEKGVSGGISNPWWNHKFSRPVRR